MMDIESTLVYDALILTHQIVDPREFPSHGTRLTVISSIRLSEYARKSYCLSIVQYGIKGTILLGSRTN